MCSGCISCGKHGPDVGNDDEEEEEEDGDEHDKQYFSLQS